MTHPNESIYEMNMRHAREHEALGDRHMDEQMEADWRESQEAQQEHEERQEEETPEDRAASLVVLAVFLASLIYHSCST